MSRSERCAAAECERWGSQKQTKKSDREGERERQTERDLYSMALWKGGRRCGEEAIGASERR